MGYLLGNSLKTSVGVPVFEKGVNITPEVYYKGNTAVKLINFQVENGKKVLLAEYVFNLDSKDIVRIYRKSEVDLPLDVLNHITSFNSEKGRLPLLGVLGCKLQNLRSITDETGLGAYVFGD